ncbi:MAG: hypothetical protein JW715_05015 [Sedimentisphaerales bacterium]|nr:hypothetical protein [Sedimentisphaerales bacterium]
MATIKNRLLIAKDDILNFFESSQQKYFDLKEMTEILDKNRKFWRLGNISRFTFIDFLIEKGQLSKSIFEFPDRNIHRYTWGKVPLYELILSLMSNSYFSHYTAMYVHDLTEQIPKTIYLNCEQSSKPKSETGLDQKRIDFAFRMKTRVSKRTANYNDYQVCLLNGKNTNSTGVVEISGPDDSKIRVTNIERTLIDIAVRPEYAGGPFEVLRAYKNAAKVVSVNKLSAILKKIDYIYPYHQVIGFYLDKCGSYRKSQIDLLRKQEMIYDFYLMHKMKNPKYSSSWKLYYPEGLA